MMEDQAHRLHPLTIVYRALKAAPQYLPIFFLIAYQRTQELSWLVIAETLIGAAVTIPYFLLWYLLFSYRFTPEGIIIQWGIVQRQERMVPYDRIQNVNIQRDLLHRLLGLAKIEIETAGAQTTEVSLNAISVAEAQQIQQLLLERKGQEHLQHSPIPHHPLSSRSAIPAYAVPNSHILLLGLVRFLPVTLFLIALIFQFLPDSLRDFILHTVTTSINRALHNPLEFPFFPTVSLLIGTVLLNQLLSAILTTLLLGNFRIEVHPTQLITTSGILTRRTYAIPRHKLQHFTITTNIVLERFQLASLGGATASQPQQGAAQYPLLPLSTYDVIAEFLQHHFSIALPSTFQPVHSRHWLRLALYRAAILSAIGSFLLLFSPTGWILLFFIPFAAFRSYLHYRHFGYALGDNVLFLRSGILRRRLTIIPLSKLQGYGGTADPLQRWWQLRTLWVETAAGTRSFNTIADLPIPTFQSLLHHIRRSVTQQTASATTGNPTDGNS